MQQHALPPPPPTLPPAIASNDSNAAASLSRQPRLSRPVAHPPTIITNLMRTQGLSPSQSQTPATSLGGGHSAFPYSPATPSSINSHPAGGVLDVRSRTASSRSQGASPATVAMANSYNPQQWSHRGSQMGFQPIQTPLSRDTRDITGMEGMFCHFIVGSICCCIPDQSCTPVLEIEAYAE